MTFRQSSDDVPETRYEYPSSKAETAANPMEKFHGFLIAHASDPDHEHIELNLTMGEWRFLFRRIN